jgi:hypothetical protein
MTLNEFYLGQVSQAANAIAALAVAQNLAFVIGIFTAEAFRKQIIVAKWYWIYVSIPAGVVISAVGIYACYHLEAQISSSIDGKSFQNIQELLMLGRIFVVALSAVPITLSMMAIRNAGS